MSGVQEMTWADLRNILGNDVNLEIASNEIAQNLRVTAASHVGEMPEVCEGGQTCRDNILQTSVLSVKTEWETTLVSIARQLENATITATHIMKTAWEAAKQCEPECPCDDILKEYREILNLQDEITREITELDVSLSLLKDE